MNAQLLATSIALTAGLGMALLVWPGNPVVSGGHRRTWPEIDRRLLVTTAATFSVAGLAGWLAFGGLVAPVVLGLLVAGTPATFRRSQERRDKLAASEAWPPLIEDVRLRAGSLGQSIPQALLGAGLAGPSPMRRAFEAAEREWLVTTDFERTIAVLKSRLGDPTADIVCETLSMANSVGGSDIDGRLRALADDRRNDLNDRRDARSKQAGVRFARRFVLVVPAGMALVGLSIGDGRAAYASAMGQAGVVVALLALCACWLWAGRLIRLPQEGRVFGD